MADKNRTTLPLANDTDDRFEESRFVLNYRPVIEFVEPAQEHYEPIVDPTPPTIDSFRDRTRALVDGLDAISKLADLAQKRVDSRVKSSGGLNIKLDPQKDAMTVAAMKRRFPDKADPTEITYDDYKKALDCLNKSAVEPPSVKSEDMKIDNPNKTDFGGYSNQHGENRAEISSPMSSVQPLDLEVFQQAGILALFAMLLPLIKAEDKKEIIQHKIDTPHK